VRDYLIVFVVALATVVVTTPLARRVSVRVGAVDLPEERRVHTRPTPRLGGLALFAGFLAALGVASQLPTFSEVFTATSEPLALVLASVAIVLVGVVDDVRGVSAPVKLAGQILAAGIVVLFGIVLLFVYIPGNPGTVLVLGRDFAALFTIAAIVAMINAVNLTDGLDGLAAGIVGIAAAGLLCYVQLSQLRTLEVPASGSLVLAILVGLCLGFLAYNFHPASVFMGDSGAMLLGLLLGAAGVSSIGGIIQPTRADFAALSVPVLIPALVLAVPFVDTTWTIFRRLRSGRAVFSPDKKHLHHRLVEMGHSHRRAVLTMYYWSSLLAFVAVGVGLLPLVQVVVIFVAGLAVGAVALFVPGWWSRRHAGDPGEGGAREIVFSFTKSGRTEPKSASDQRKRASREL
jgi:UDP-GlcNAc:undecaprenyl-phosphate/decaprenyl-phosphate GlcNAc-1-phosphate transferase